VKTIEFKEAITEVVKAELKPIVTRLDKIDRTVAHVSYLAPMLNLLLKLVYLFAIDC
jgi:hypothetical protein